MRRAIVERVLIAAFVTLLTTSFCGHLVVSEEQQTGAEQEAKVDDMDAVTEAPEDKGPQPSDDADVTFMFTRPIVDKPYEFPIGKEVHFLVGFKNKAQKDFQISTIDASFKYLLDFSYTLQNFTSYPYNRNVEPNQETTIGYTLFVSDQYAPRSYGFTVNLLYSDKDGVQYKNTVFNETVALTEVEEGFNAETLFLYVILAGLLSLAGYGLNKLYVKYVNPTRRSASKPVEQEKVSNSKEVDFDWLPQSMVQNLKKTSTATKKAPAN